MTIAGFRALSTCVIACVMALLLTPTGAAQPSPPSPLPDQQVGPAVESATPEAVAACRQFARALDLAAAGYSEFANVLAIGQVNPDYNDPILTANNSYGRTGLREAAGTALTASRTPGLAPAMADPMRSWSMKAMKLMLLMGLRADVDRFNAAAEALNADSEAAKMACAHAGTQA